MSLGSTATTTLQAEVDAVMADVVDANGVAFVGLTYALGRREGPAHRSPPSVVWVVNGGAGAPAQKHAFPGGRRALLTRMPVLAAVCWGVDTDSAMELASGVLAAAVRRWGPRFAYQGEQWATDPAVTELGEAVTLTFAMQLAVLDRAPLRATVTTTSFDTSNASSTDGLLTPGEPG